MVGQTLFGHKMHETRSTVWRPVAHGTHCVEPDCGATDVESQAMHPFESSMSEYEPSGQGLHWPGVSGDLKVPGEHVLSAGEKSVVVVTKNKSETIIIVINDERLNVDVDSVVAISTRHSATLD